MKTLRTQTLILLLVLVISSLATSACSRKVTRNVDQSLTVQTSITQDELETTIATAIADPLIKNITVTFLSGYLTVSAERQRLNDSSKSDTLTFRMDLRISNTHLLATVSNAQVDGVAIEKTRVDHWNLVIANRLEKLAQKQPNTTLQAVTITPQGICMTWLVKK